MTTTSHEVGTAFALHVRPVACSHSNLAALRAAASFLWLVTVNTCLFGEAAMPPGERAGTVIDKLLPLLADSIAAGALAAIPPGERAGTVIDKLLPLLA